MSLNGILSDELTVVKMRALAGKHRCKGATTKADLICGVLLALSERENGKQALPVSAQKKIAASPVAQRELSRVSQAVQQCANWRQVRQVLERFPPSILLQILSEEMTVAQMKKMAGTHRCDGATLKDELLFAVLLALAERGDKAMRDLPANAQSRIEASPIALDWVKLVERADAEVLSKVGTWSGFRSLLCEPRDEAAVGEDGDDDVEDDNEEEEVEEEEDDDDDEEEDEKAVAAAAKVAALERQLVEARLAEAKLASTAKATRTKASRREGAAPKQLDFESADEKKKKTAVAASDAAGKKAGKHAAAPAPPYWMSALEVALTFLLPVMLILGAINSGKAMPGKPGDDLRLHSLAR